MWFAGLFIHQNYNNPQFSLDDVKDFINMNHQGLIDEFKKVIQTDSGCHNVFLPHMLSCNITIIKINE